MCEAMTPVVQAALAYAAADAAHVAAQRHARAANFALDWHYADSLASAAHAARLALLVAARAYEAGEGQGT